MLFKTNYGELSYRIECIPNNKIKIVKQCTRCKLFRKECEIQCKRCSQTEYRNIYSGSQCTKNIEDLVKLLEQHGFYVTNTQIEYQQQLGISYVW